jgi:hypothetical protein
VLVDHVCDAKALVDDLTPAVPVKVLRGELGGTEVPGGGVAVCWVGVYCGKRLVGGGEEFAETKEVAVDAVARGCGGDVLDVGGDGRAEERITGFGLFPSVNVRFVRSRGKGLDLRRCLGLPWRYTTLRFRPRRFGKFRSGLAGIAWWLLIHMWVGSCHTYIGSR